MSMSQFPHLCATPLLFRDSSLDRDYLPDSYHHFGLGVHPHYGRTSSLPCRKNPPPIFNEDGFQASLDVHEFLPSELVVKTYDSIRTIVVEGKHPERPDIESNSDIERSFVRKFILPEDIDLHNVVAMLSADGILTLQAQKINKKNERILPIFQTGPAHLSIKHTI